MRLCRAAAGRSRRLWWLGAAVVVLLAAGAVGFALWPSSASPGTPATPEPATLTPAEATALAGQLSSPDPSVVAGALVSSVRDTFLAHPAPVLPAGDALTIDAATFQVGSGGDGYGSVQATATGPQAGTFLLFLVREDGTWRVLQTVAQQ
jgi:hypothetical protein